MSIPRHFTSFTQQEINQLFKNASRIVKASELTILIVPTSGPYGKLLVITPRAVGNAPTRNRIRRQIKSIFLEQALFSKGFNWIFIIKSGHGKIDFDRLKELIQQAVSKTAELKRTTPGPIP
jgi:ribonuclease P protein component